MAEKHEAGATERGELLDPAFWEAVDQVVEEDTLDYQENDTETIVRIANTIIQQATMDGASEIDVEPLPDGVKVGFRIAGAMREAMKLPKRMQRRLIARYKRMAEMNVGEQSTPQNGRIGVTHRGVDYDLQVSSHPGPNGERIVMGITW
jgi:type II secretory ATPase GspE/PulE/Tfp pilus assembly ATPase PilB-like protein